jgi:hypothetical protein
MAKKLSQDVINRQQQYASLGLSDAEKYKTINELDSALVKNVYKLDPATYTGKGGVVDIAKAKAKYDFEQPKLANLSNLDPKNFTQAVTNYSSAINKIQQIGAENVNKEDLKTLGSLARQVRDFDSKSLSPNAKNVISNISDVVDAINAINNQRELVETQRLRSLGLEKDGVTKIKLSGKEREAARNRLTTEQDTLTRLINTANQAAPKLGESLTRYNLSDVVQGIGGVSGVSKLRTGLESGSQLLGTGTLGAKLNSQVTDEQILSDINTGNKARYKELYDIGTNATIDLQSQLDQAKQFLSDLPANDPRRSATQSQIDSIQKDLTQAQSDTLKAKDLYENYQPISGEQASSAISSFRESLQLPEQRTLAQIKEIDPTTYESIINLQKQYATLAKEPIAPTTSPETEAFRRDVEQRIGAQVALGSQLGAEEQRQYQQAARAAQTARGNIFGVAPAVEEAVTTGAAGEQRLAARLGAAQGFLSSGQTMSDALARDVALRNSLQQSRLGAAADFMAGGPTAYNLASQRAAQQQGVLQNYLAAAQPQATGGFQATSSANIPYAYVNPQAGFLGAQNAANIYKTLSDYQAQTYGDYTRAIASQPTFAQQFGAITSGVSGFVPKFSFTG